MKKKFNVRFVAPSNNMVTFDVPAFTSATTILGPLTQTIALPHKDVEVLAHEILDLLAKEHPLLPEQPRYSGIATSDSDFDAE